LSLSIQGRERSKKRRTFLVVPFKTFEREKKTFLTFNQGVLLCCIVNLLVNFIALGGICISMLAWKEKTCAVTESLEFLPQSSPTL